MTTDQKIDALTESLVSLNAKLDTKFEQIDKRFDAIDTKLLEHDKKFLDHDKKFLEHDDLLKSIGSAYVEVSRKLDAVIEQTKEIPVIKRDISAMQHHLANIDHDIIDLKQGVYDRGIRYAKLEDKVDYLVDSVDKIGAREYA